MSEAKSKLPDTPFRRLLGPLLVDFGGDDDDAYYKGFGNNNNYADYVGPGV